MVESRLFATLVVVGGLVVGLILPLALGPRLVSIAPTPIARVAQPTPTVAPAVTFTPVATSTRPEITVSSTTETTPPRPTAASTATPTPLLSVVVPTPAVAVVPAPTTPPTLTPPPAPSATAPPAGATPTSTASPRPSPTRIVYIVRSGDTVYSIGRTFGVSPDAIVTANGMTDPNQLSVGQKLIIPPA